MVRPPPRSTRHAPLFPYTTPFRSFRAGPSDALRLRLRRRPPGRPLPPLYAVWDSESAGHSNGLHQAYHHGGGRAAASPIWRAARYAVEEHGLHLTEDDYGGRTEHRIEQPAHTSEDRRAGTECVRTVKSQCSTKQ